MQLSMIAFLAIKAIAAETNNTNPHTRAVSVAQGLDLTPAAVATVIELVEEWDATLSGLAREVEANELIIPALRAYAAAL